MNIAILTPSQNPYSETFIQAHKHYLKDKVFYYYGVGETIQLESKGALVSNWRRLYFKTIAKLLKKPCSYVRDCMLRTSFKQHAIHVVLVEYGTHAHHLSTFLGAINLPIFVHFHGYDASIKDVILRCNNYQGVFKFATKVIAVSKVMETNLLNLGCPKNKLVYNVYGPQPEFETIKPTFSTKQFIAVGRFTDKKAPYYTILAFKPVAEQHPDATLLMAGDGSLLSTCKNLAHHLGLTKQVQFLGVITPERFRELLSTSLAFVQHSITAENGDMEGTPLSVLEASVAGLPVISTCHAGIPDVIVHEQTGLLCEEHDVTTMTNYMLKVLEDRTYTKQLGKAGKKRILELFTLKRHIEALQTILKEANMGSKT